MQKRLIVVLLLCAVAALLVIILRLLGETPPRLPVEEVEAPPTVLPPAPVDDLKAVRQEGTLRGKVIHGISGEPIRGAKVIALAPHLQKDKDDDIPFWGEMIERGSVVTDEKGTFALEALPPDYWNLWVERRGFAWASVPRVKFGEEHIIRLYPECSVKGKVVFPDGSPAAGVRIEYTPQGTESEVFSRYRLKTYYIATGADGTFEYRGLISGPFTIEVYPEGYLPAPWAYEPPLNPGENRDLGVHKLDIGFSLTVKVIWRDTEEPVPGIEVAVRAAADPMPRTKVGRRILTDAKGIARFSGLGGQVLDKPQFIVAANVPGVGPVVPDEQRLFGPSENVVIKLRRDGIVKGKVLRPDGNPLESFFVELLPKGFLARQMRVRAENGEFKVYQVPEGDYTLAVRYGNLVDQEVSVTVVGGEEVDAGTITLATGGEVYGTVRLESGRALGDLEDAVRVHLSRKVYNDRLKRDEWVPVKRAVCRPDGTYRMSGVPQGEFWIWPEPPRVTGTTPPVRVLLGPGMGAVEQDLFIFGTGYLRLKFVDEIEGQRRQVVQPPTYLVHKATGTETRWMSEGTALRPGEYEMYVEIPDPEGVPHRYRAPDVRVQDGERTDPIEVRLFEIRHEG